MYDIYIMKSFTAASVETMDQKGKKKAKRTSNPLTSTLSAASSNESATAASSMTGMTLSAKSSMTASFLSASQFRSVLLVTKTVATLFLIWVVYKLLTMTQAGMKKDSMKSLVMIHFEGGEDKEYEGSYFSIFNLLFIEDIIEIISNSAIPSSYPKISTPA